LAAKNSNENATLPHFQLTIPLCVSIVVPLKKKKKEDENVEI